MNLRLRQARLQARLTQEELANALGTTPTSIWRWESGKNQPSKYFQAMICAHFNCAPTVFGWSSTSNTERERDVSTPAPR